ncbi:non-ribosomal peptide synthetase, partial [Streptomyces sp. SID7760]|nr:non-ribosomal peptide synthetase [Streptomyces sp. SID7760]
DDFFALGGHSLKAFALMAAVRREFGVELPLNLVFRRRTVELLCEALPEAGAAAARLLVPLADGDPSRPPLVLVHPRGGDVVCYRDLVRDLSARPGGDRRILGLESVGYNTGERPLETVPEMAERYLAVLREEQPHGPYLLAGWSFGGTVAYEMAARLEAAGEEVAFLGLIDAAAPGAAPGNRSGTAAGPGDPDLLRYGIAAGIDADSARELDEEELLDVLVRRGRAEGTLPRSAPTEALRRVLRVAEANGAASAAYRTDAVLAVGLHLFTVDE